MKTKKSRSLIATSLILSIFFSGCNSGGDAELDELINGLQTAHINGGSVEPDSTGEGKEFFSLTGTIVSATEKSITVRSGESEYQITLDDSTQIYGGSIEKSLYVTVTYEDNDDPKKKIKAKIITILSDNDNASTVHTEATESQQTDPSSSESGEADPTETTYFSEFVTSTAAVTVTKTETTDPIQSSEPETSSQFTETTIAQTTIL